MSSVHETAVPITREPVSAAERRAAASLQVLIDSKLGRRTPGWIQRLADEDRRARGLLSDVERRTA